MMPIRKIACGNAGFVLRLNLDNREYCSVSGSCEEFIFPNFKYGAGRFRGALIFGVGAPEFYLLPLDRTERTRPWIERSNLSRNMIRRFSPIDQAFFLF